MAPSKDSLSLKASIRRIEWEIVIFIFAVFFIPLFIVNSGMLGIKHPIEVVPISVHHNNVLLPVIHPSIGEAFDGNRMLLWQDLISQCRVIRNSSSPASACSLGDENIFDKFLDLNRNLYGRTHESITKESWRAHCQLQLVVKETRSPLLCEAAAFVALPFHLKAENRRHIEEEMEKEDESKKYDPASLRLVVATVYSSFQQKLKLTKAISMTIKSSCYRNISMNVLGSGNKEIATGLGLKISLLKAFVASIKDPENVVLLFVDGEDVMFQTDSNTILQKFLSTGHRILFSAEHSCSPMKSFPWNLNLETWLGPCQGTTSCSNGRYVCDTLYPQPSPKLKDRSNRWLNSGGFIGFASDLREMFESVGRIPADILQAWPGTDQGLYTHLLLGGNWNIHLDYESKIFLSFGLQPDPQEEFAKRVTTKTLLKEIAHFDSFGNRTLTTYKSNVDGSTPSIIHFNADGKSILESANKNYMNVNFFKCKKSIKVY